MTEKLKRFTSEADHHKVLDIAYLLGTVIGLQQALSGISAIQHGNGNLAIYVLVVQMMAMSIFGALGYLWHIRGKVYSEFIAIFLVLPGLLTVMVGTAVIAFNTPPLDPFVVNMGGMALGLGIFVCIELIERIWKIQTRKTQIKISKLEREKAARRNPEEIAREAQEIIKSLEA